MEIAETVVISIEESIEPHLRYSLSKSGFSRIRENAPTTKDDLKIVRSTLPPNQRRVSAEDLFLKKDIYQHVPTQTEISMIDYESLPNLPVVHHDPIIQIDTDAPRQAKIALAKALLNSLDVDLTERTIGILEGTCKAETVLAHALDAIEVIERIYSNLLGRNIQIDHRAYWAKILSKLAYNIPRLALGVRNDMLGEIIEERTEQAVKSQEVVAS
ncbi:MAG: hypothetical protein QXU32_07580 [Nitrososphaerales archaeon]